MTISFNPEGPHETPFYQWIYRKPPEKSRPGYRGDMHVMADILSKFLLNVNLRVLVEPEWIQQNDGFGRTRSRRFCRYSNPFCILVEPHLSQDTGIDAPLT